MTDLDQLINGRRNSTTSNTLMLGCVCFMRRTHFYTQRKILNLQQLHGGKVEHV
jgi:hypothetical protein